MEDVAKDLGVDNLVVNANAHKEIDDILLAEDISLEVNLCKAGFDGTPVDSFE